MEDRKRLSPSVAIPDHRKFNSVSPHAVRGVKSIYRKRGESSDSQFNFSSIHFGGSQSSSTFIDVRKIEGNTIQNLVTQIRIRNKTLDYSLNDRIFEFKKTENIDRDWCQGWNVQKSKKVKLGHCKFCGDTYCRDCLYFKYKIYKMKDNEIEGSSLSKREARICRIWHAKFIVKDHLTELIDQVRLKEDEIAIQIKEYQSSEQIDQELKLQVSTIKDNTVQIQKDQEHANRLIELEKLEIEAELFQESQLLDIKRQEFIEMQKDLAKLQAEYDEVCNEMDNHYDKVIRVSEQNRELDNKLNNMGDQLLSFHRLDNRSSERTQSYGMYKLINKTDRCSSSTGEWLTIESPNNVGSIYSKGTNKSLHDLSNIVEAAYGESGSIYRKGSSQVIVDNGYSCKKCIIF